VESGFFVAKNGQIRQSGVRKLPDGILGQEKEAKVVSAKSWVLDAIWQGKDPLSDFPFGSHPVDHQGWNSDHRYLIRAIDETAPKIIVEVGVWKGGSVKTMAARAKELGLDCVVVAIDTWLGSSEHWLNADERSQLRFLNGYPRLYHTFVANVIDKGLQDYVVPLPLDSINALHLLRAKHIFPDVVHIDAGHDYQSASSDLRNWWDSLADGGVLIGDDYYTDGVTWQDVRRAFDDFFKDRADIRIEASDGKCFVRKPFGTRIHKGDS
jgi:predicted O-methyltransferase YrrM